MGYFAVLLLLLLVAVTCFYGIWPRILTWGATPGEARQSLPGGSGAETALYCHTRHYN